MRIKFSVQRKFLLYARIRTNRAVTFGVTNALQEWVWKLPSSHEKFWFCMLDLFFLHFWPFRSALDHFSHIDHAWFRTKHVETASPAMHFYVSARCFNVPSSKTWNIDQTWIESCFRCSVFNFTRVKTLHILGICRKLCRDTFLIIQRRTTSNATAFHLILCMTDKTTQHKR